MFIATLIILAVISGFNLLVDPYEIWNIVELNGVNADKSHSASNERVFKIIGLSKRQASIVILGTSRSDIGLNPDHAALGTDALNLGTYDQPYLETRLIFDLMANRKVKTVIIGLDFFAANALKPYPADFEVKNFVPLRNLQLLFSISTLKDSVFKIAKTKVLGKDTWSEKGLRLWSVEDIKRKGGHRKYMIKSEMGSLHEYLPPPSCSFNFVSAEKSNIPLEEIRAILSRAHREHITLKLLISPAHARQWETLATSGLWNKWEEWKHRLVQMNEEEAQRTGQSPFPLWDFSGYHSISTETVPTLGNTKTFMHWYFESSHYTPAAGDLVLDRIFNFKSRERSVADDFGVLLNSGNIDTHLSNIRLARVHYRQTHPEDVTEIESMAQEELAKTKSCNKQLVATQ